MLDGSEERGEKEKYMRQWWIRGHWEGNAYCAASNHPYVKRSEPWRHSRIRSDIPHHALSLQLQTSDIFERALVDFEAIGKWKPLSLLINVSKYILRTCLSFRD
jgi:hypothetical protein